MRRSRRVEAIKGKRPNTSVNTVHVDAESVIYVLTPGAAKSKSLWWMQQMATSACAEVTRESSCVCVCICIHQRIHILTNMLLLLFLCMILGQFTDYSPVWM